MKQSELVKAHQHELNKWTKKYLRGIQPLTVDGKKGHQTFARVMAVKYYLGYGKDRTAGWTTQFAKRMHHSHSLLYSSPAMIATGQKRRLHQRWLWRRNASAARFNRAVVTFDGKPCSGSIAYWLQVARDEGWRGRLVSGYRTPAYSEHLCYGICGRPSCPGTCAGRATNHAHASPHGSRVEGAADVTDYIQFAQYMNRHGNPIYNALPRDRVHFSRTGR